jgi:hypothetical protein
LTWFKPILLGLAAALLLANPLDCYSQLATEQPSSCCASRHCNPAGASRSCCKVKLFENAQYYQAGKKSSVPALDFSAMPVEPAPQLESLAAFSRSVVDLIVHPPPGDLRNTSLPLLI